MIGEIDIAGIFISPLLLCLLSAFIGRVMISTLFEKANIYKVVWHRPLFDMSLFFILLGISLKTFYLITG
ncbi:MAG: hypothetical protein ACJA2Y_001163 [Cycloclasticus pugetii]|jgi:hypothetical protein|uniref:DUF1656 domain-containing protein n=2 Tax=Cycloclasticus TaxID=34067 RepID=S5T992_9GAMM|nr:MULTISPECIES: DUF1656 domain-containing protein [Cycloclasticus]AGS40281.1 hypothetical protein CYCME_1966 [Cycloclasticus zancles 78-ME]ATI03693.1 DUF1656 domain-containing protein [Cycloclasticus sp. PY97N]EPD14184.1 hypothetical protein L196_01765 [Cycloclasticus pugetii]MDF1828681.1 DUF1656 domain-containing protein [Cycloclasticus pugetii]